VVNVLNEIHLKNTRFETKENKTFFKCVETCRDVCCYQDINASLKHTLHETRVENEIDMSCDMKYFGKQEKQLIAADKRICKYL